MTSVQLNSATVGYVVMDQKPEAVKYGDEEGRPIPSVVAIDKTTGAVFNGRDAWDKKMELSESCEYCCGRKQHAICGVPPVVGVHAVEVLL